MLQYIFAILLIFINVYLIITIIEKLSESILLRKVVKNPEKYDIVPGHVIKVLYEEGGSETFNVIIKDFDKNLQIVSFIDESKIKRELSQLYITEFYKLYILGFITKPNYYSFFK